MHIIQARNVNDALPRGLCYLAENGVTESSRNGPVLVAPGPVTTVYSHPTERVLFSPTRDANPFFHLAEALWMMAGRDDVAFPCYFNSRFGEYSDDGLRLNGAYGHRWRTWFGKDQLRIIAEELKRDPASRRAVLGMWSPGHDLGKVSRDLPCNTHIYFSIRKGALDMSVCCRSNDIIWGAYGANAVHMSVLQEVMAAWVGVPVGVYYQISNNYHLYTETFPAEKQVALIEDDAVRRFYELHHPYGTRPVVSVAIEKWLNDLTWFIFNPLTKVGYNDTFFANTAVPMYAAWHERKTKQGTGRNAANDIEAPDWREACVAWIDRRSL